MYWGGSKRPIRGIPYFPIYGVKRLEGVVTSLFHMCFILYPIWTHGGGSVRRRFEHASLLVYTASLKWKWRGRRRGGGGRGDSGGGDGRRLGKLPNSLINFEL